MSEKQKTQYDFCGKSAWEMQGEKEYFIIDCL